ncbi:MAG: hypothetical protein E6J51_04160 [Chloroflexi bacterium]|nr:MAG: hypothetical protein E6J51_04160 [Chloroflexota bacterium]
MPRSAYERSKGVETVSWREFPLGKGIALSILEESTAAGRQARGQALLDVLDAAAGLPPCRLTVADRPQRHRTRGGRLQQVLAPKVFLETLLHEWVHHYDFTGLQLDRSPHTSGFFNRIRDLAETLGVGYVTPPKREAPAAELSEDVVITGPDRLRPGGVPPPKWIRDQVLALFGRPRT